MDYIYGRLNQKVEKQTYRGKSTDTTNTTINNTNGKISVDISPDYTRKIENEIKQSTPTYTIEGDDTLVLGIGG